MSESEARPLALERRSDAETVLWNLLSTLSNPDAPPVAKLLMVAVQIDARSEWTPADLGDLIGVSQSMASHYARWLVSPPEDEDPYLRKELRPVLGGHRTIYSRWTGVEGE